MPITMHEEVRQECCKNHACSSVKNAAKSASVFHQCIKVIKPFAHATTTGRPRKVEQNAPELWTYLLLLLVLYTNNIIYEYVQCWGLAV